jgi:hypothetical protein
MQINNDKDKGNVRYERSTRQLTVRQVNKDLAGREQRREGMYDCVETNYGTPFVIGSGGGVRV